MGVTAVVGWHLRRRRGLKWRRRDAEIRMGRNYGGCEWKEGRGTRSECNEVERGEGARDK